MDGVEILRIVVLTLLLFKLWRRAKRVQTLERELLIRRMQGR